MLIKDGNLIITFSDRYVLNSLLEEDNVSYEGLGSDIKHKSLKKCAIKSLFMPLSRIVEWYSCFVTWQKENVNGDCNTPTKVHWEIQILRHWIQLGNKIVCFIDNIFSRPTQKSTWPRVPQQKPNRMFSIGIWIIAENKLCDQKCLWFLCSLLIMIIFKNEHNVWILNPKYNHQK